MSALDHDIRWWREDLERDARLSREDLDELEDHLRILIAEQLESGCSERQAFARARKQLSDVSALADKWVSAPVDPGTPDPYATSGPPLGWTPPVRRYTGVEFVSSLLQDLRYSLRTLAKRPAFSLAVILVLAIGIGINGAMFSLIHGILWRPPNLENPEQIVVFASTDAEGRTMDGLSYLDFLDYSRETGAVSGLALHFPISMQLRTSAGSGAQTEGGTPIVWGSITSSGFFEVLGVRPAMGQTFGSRHGVDQGQQAVEAVVVISHALWQRRLGADPDVLGREVQLNGETFTIVGVAPAGFRGAHALLSSDLYIPLSAAPLILPATREILDDRKRRTIWAVGRLAPDVTLDQTQMRFQEIAAQLASEYPESNTGIGIVVHPESHSRMGMGSGPVLRLASIVMLVSVALVLLVACVNVANLVLAKASGQQREISIRLAMGASRKRVVRQMLTESMVLALCGGAAGLALAAVSMRVLAASLTTTGLPVFFDAALDARVLLYALALTITTALFFGLIPALHVSRSEWGASLRSEGRALNDGGASGGLRRALVVAEVAACLVLLMVAALFARSLQNVVAVDVGFEPRDRIAATVDLTLNGYDEERRSQFYRDLKQRISIMPGVESATWAMPLPLDTFATNAFLYVDGYERGSSNEPLEVLYSTVDEAYFETMGTPILRGRGIEATDRAGRAPVAVINQIMAERFWPGREAIGQTFRLETPDAAPVEVVGIAADGKYRQVAEDPIPYVYLAYEQGTITSVGINATLVVHSAQPSSAIAEQLRTEARALDEEVMLPNVRTLEEHLRRSAFLPARAAAMLVSGFGLIALALAVIGLYGLLSYSVHQQTGEIGLRIAMGATRGHIMKMVLGAGLRLTAVGVAIGLVIAVLAGQVVVGLLYNVSAIDPVSFVVVPPTLALVTLLACLIPALRATRVDPLTALQTNR